jgi:hypothetical protein
MRYIGYIVYGFACGFAVHFMIKAGLLDWLPF